MENVDDCGRRESRQRKKQSEHTCCPVCGVTVRLNEIEHHYAIEMDRLLKLTSPIKIRRQTQQKELNSTASTSSNSSGSVNNSNDMHISCWNTYQKIRANRQSRLKLKSRKRKAEEGSLCPVCNERIHGDINVHVENCLRKTENILNGNDTDDDDSIDIEGEEYEWAGETRIRTSTLLESGYAGIGVGTTINSVRNNQSDEDEDLNVDGDDTHIFGASQYSERDIIPVMNHNKKEDSDSLYLRNLVIGSNNVNHPTTATPSGSNSNNYEIQQNDCGGGGSGTKDTGHQSSSYNNICTNYKNNHSTTTQLPANAAAVPQVNIQIIETLRRRIKDLENQIKNKCICLICLDEYRIPVVSICCWHVHCEECWLRTLGARKLCPQCNMITSPSDLRKIYM